MKPTSRAVRALALSLSLFTITSHANPVYAADNPQAPMRDTRFFHEPPTVDAMAEILFPRRTRGIVLASTESQDNDNAQTTAGSSTITEKSVGMPVLFHFGRTSIVDESRPFLDTVGKLMQRTDYAEETLIIEGHTDAVGTRENNHSLSELRALAIKRYLVREFGINPLRLFPTGKGESQLFDRADPFSGTNRRVEFLRYNNTKR